MGAVRVGTMLLAVVLLVGAASSTHGQTGLPAEEFLGPFSSWTEVQCGGVDDTAVLQAALSALGVGTNSPVLYLGPGTCRISSTLTLSSRNAVTVIGADPARTTIVWGSASSGTMFNLAGVGHSRFGRLTWDHAGVGGLIYEGAWPGSDCCFPTDNRHEDEVFKGAIDQPGSGAFFRGRRGG